MNVKYKIGRKTVSDGIELIFVETETQGDITSNVILDTIETKVIFPNVVDFVDIQPKWLNHDKVRLYVTNISKWAIEEGEIEI